MKIVQINSVSYGSTGKIMMDIHSELLKKGFDSYVVWGRGRKELTDKEIYLDEKLEVYYHVLFSRLTGKTGFASTISTKKLIDKLDLIKPDIIHLHNVHGYYINIELLFNYIRKKHIKVVWTLHDCWAFTGQCPHFTTVKCNKWINGCNNCPKINEYPKTLRDNSEWNYNKKKELFSNLSITIVTPSVWLSKIVKQSFLSDYSVYVINNGIDTNIFKCRESNFREKYKLRNKKIILGVSSVWDKTKGLDDFISLSKVIGSEAIIVLVGVNKKQIKELPNNIIGITKTDNQIELSEIYSSADVFLNPTYEDNYPTVNLEAISCGTPVFTYNTGGSPESAMLYGRIIDKDALLNNYKILFKKQKKQNFDLSRDKMCYEYIELYKKI